MNRSNTLVVALILGWASSHGVLAQAEVQARPDFGVLLMAHGGTPEWDNEVLAAVRPLHDRYKVEIAFGMADPATIQEATKKLEAKGVTKIAVVRLFISGESWFERTEQILGLRAGAPPRPAPTTDAAHAGHGGHHSMELWRAETKASFALTTQGLAEAFGMGAVLADRARTLSRNPKEEDVLILAHGPGDDAENARWVAMIDARAKPVREALPFRRVEVMTLREDWPDKRPAAERRIKAFVAAAKAQGGAAIVIPFRLQGFGPYAEVLEGLDYVSDGYGLIPHANVTRWIEDQIKGLEAGPFRAPIAP